MQIKIYLVMFNGQDHFSIETLSHCLQLVFFLLS